MSPTFFANRGGQAGNHSLTSAARRQREPGDPVHPVGIGTPQQTPEHPNDRSAQLIELVAQASSPCNWAGTARAGKALG
jgi:hypothetical protein